MKGLILAFQFFTRIPINIAIDFNRQNIKRAFYFFPLIGILIGFITYLPFFIIPHKYIGIACFLCLVNYLVLSGGLHLDGLADTVDGFFSAREKEKVLKIMADPHIGSYGVIGLILILLLRYLTYKELFFQPSIFILAGAISRLSGLAIVLFSKPAKNTGLGAMFHQAASKLSFFIWLFIIALLCIFTPELSSFSIYIKPVMLSARLKYLLLILIPLLLTFIIVQISYKKIDGTTGDVNGFVVEFTETICLLLSIFI